MAAAPSTAAQYKYKTNLCTAYAAARACRYGSTCRFAHGSHELRPRPLAALYKTAPCRNGPACPFGAKCNFQHDAVVRVRVLAVHRVWEDVWRVTLAVKH